MNAADRTGIRLVDQIGCGFVFGKALSALPCLLVLLLCFAGARAQQHEPIGNQRVLEYAFSQPGEGWGGVGNLQIAQDPSAPKSPANVGQAVYPAGFVAGGAPLTMERSLGGHQQIYVSFWVKFSANWQGHASGVNKIFHFWVPKEMGDLVYLSAQGVGSESLQPQVRLSAVAANQRNLNPNINTTEIVRGQWHHWELILRMNNGGNPDGQVLWWIDDRKVGEYRDIQWVNAGESHSWTTIHWSPTWGGMDGIPVTATQTQSIDHMYVSGGAISAPVGGNNAIPAAPGNLLGTAVSASQVNLTWKDNSSDEAGFQIERKVSPTGGWTKFGVVTANQTTYSAMGLGSSHTFYFRVCAISKNGPSGYSNEVSATTFSTGIALGTANGVQPPMLMASRVPGGVEFSIHSGKGVYAMTAHDMLGREVWRHAGTGEAVWNHAGKIRIGIYLVRAEQNGKTLNTTYCHIW